MDILKPIGFLILLIVGAGLFIGFLLGVGGVLAKVIEVGVGLPWLRRRRHIRDTLGSFAKSEFDPNATHVHGSNGIAVDSINRRVFLANSKMTKLYNASDILNVEAKYGEFNTGVLRLSVRDPAMPFFEIKAGILASRKLRVIESLLMAARDKTESRGDLSNS